MSDETFRPHPLEWTDAQVQRFWDYYSSKPGRAEVYFAHKFGRSILRTVSRHADLSGVVVDLGCGPGYLVDLLLQEEVQVVAIDSSPASVAAVGAKFAQRSGFRGALEGDVASIPLDDSSVDAVLLIETVEHLRDDTLRAGLREVRRVLRPGGTVIITTPNKEDLGESTVLCPNCGSEFHVMQHVRSLSAESLEQAMDAAGFATILCAATAFTREPTLKRLYDRLKYDGRARALLERLAGDSSVVSLPHLLYIGKARAGDYGSPNREP